MCAFHRRVALFSLLATLHLQKMSPPNQQPTCSFTVRWLDTKDEGSTAQLQVRATAAAAL